MKSKILFLLSILTISATLLSGCKSTDSVESSETIETTAIESETTPTESQTDDTIEISNSGSSMGQMSAPEIQSNDFVVEPFGPQTMYVIESVSAKEGPNAEEFADSCYLFKGEGVSIVGVVNSYKGEECLWYRANTGEFISAEFITTEKDKISTESSTQTEGKESVDPLAEFTDEEIQAILGTVDSGNESQFSSDEEKFAYLDSVADTGEIVTIDGRTGMIVSEPSKRYGKLYSMVDENGELIFAYGGKGKPGMNAPDGTWPGH